MKPRRRLVAVIAAAVLGVGTVVAWTRGHHDAQQVAVPTATLRQLGRYGITVTDVESPAGAVPSSRVLAELGRDRRPAVLGIYLVHMADDRGAKNCTCWMVVYHPTSEMVSTFGIPATFAADFFDAKSGAFTTGVEGSV